jgi:hypothetical protein
MMRGRRGGVEVGWEWWEAVTATEEWFGAWNMPDIRDLGTSEQKKCLHDEGTTCQRALTSLRAV